MNDHRLSEQEVLGVCGLGRGEVCCRFLLRGPEGWGCAKLTELREYIDDQVARGEFNARGDNCEGV